MRAAAAALVAAALTLTACAQAIEPPAPGLSTDELASYNDYLADILWEGYASPGEPQPEIGPVTYVDDDEIGDYLATCMNEAGYDNYVGDGSSYTVTNSQFLEDEMRDAYICGMRFQTDPSDYAFNAAQIDYVYDYYVASLVPCLQRAGYDVATAPSRSEFAAKQGYWNPYVELPTELFMPTEGQPEIIRRCPPLPIGFDASAYFGF